MGCVLLYDAPSVTTLDGNRGQAAEGDELSSADRHKGRQLTLIERKFFGLKSPEQGETEATHCAGLQVRFAIVERVHHEKEPTTQHQNA